MRCVQTYREKEIDEEKISRLRQIAKERYAQPIYDSSYWSIEDVRGLAFMHDIDIEDEILVLGDDWFLCYTISDSIVTILEWVALDDSNTKFLQTVEMMNAFRDILFKCHDKQFLAGMRHDTSYQFYMRMLEKGYLKEASHTYSIDHCNGFAPEVVRMIDYNYPGIDDFIDSDVAHNNPEYLTYILHCLAFYVTSDFTNKYSRTRKTMN